MDKPIGHRITWVDSLDSTNNEITRRLDRGPVPEHGEIIAAVEQYAGKGLSDNTWTSDPGMNLTFSFLIRPAFIKATQQFYLNIFVSLGVCQFVHDLFPEMEVRIKWPNDIYVGKQKIAGILISHAVSGTDIMHTVVGIGLNVNQTDFPAGLPNPVSMKQLAGKQFDISSVLNELNLALNHSWQNLSAARLVEIRNEYESVMFGYGKWMSFRHESKVITARIKGVSEIGLLQLEDSAGDILECDLKEIAYPV